jgi:formate-nitrite transporter family protein
MPAEPNASAAEERAQGNEQTEESDSAASPDSSGNQSGAGSEAASLSPQKNLERPSAEEIYQQVARNAQAELKRTSFSLAVSGFTGGAFMGFSALGVGLILATLGHTPVTYVISRMFYPLGFIVVIIGRSQLFTENTLYPVALVLSEKREIWNTLRLWAIVLPCNVLGALAFAGLISLTHAGSPSLVQSIAEMGMDAARQPTSAVFWTGVMGGWIIATTAWLVSGSHSITGSVMVIWLLTFLVGLGNFAHCIATSGEILTAVLSHHISWPAYPRWFGPAVGGNICGGVLMVTLLEYGQAMFGKDLKQETDSALKPAS